MRPIAPRIPNAREVTLAEEQEEYRPITVAVVLRGGITAIVTRWQPNDADRAALLAGEDVYVTLLTGGLPVQPLDVQVGPPPVEA